MIDPTLMTNGLPQETEGPGPTGERISLRAAFARLASSPFDLLVRHWNWKAAVLSGVMRGAIFFATNLLAGWRAATAAMATQFVYRALASGLLAAAAQAFRTVEPAWQATVVLLIWLPALSHLFEFLVHRAIGTPRLTSSVTASLLFTALSTVFNLFAMRRGALLVEPGHASLAGDMRRMPAIVLAFLLIVPRTVWRWGKSFLREKERQGTAQ